MTTRSAGDSRGDGELYVITLCTATLPMVLRVPFVHELVGFSVFRSRTLEDGCERFRLYVGYFDSATRAHEALTVVRKHYPSAWISCAPRSGLGSLDDTMNTAFRMIRRATASVVAPADRPSDAGGDVSGQPADPPPQRYVVQLDWSADAVPSSKIPQLAVLRAYNLYRALLSRDDDPHHALRLGFFKNIHGAQQVAQYVRVHFPRVSVVPISHREFTRAVEMLDRRAVRLAATPRRAAAAATRPLAGDASPQAGTIKSPAPATASIAPATRLQEQQLTMLGADELEGENGSTPSAAQAPSDGSFDPPRAPRNIRSR